MPFETQVQHHQISDVLVVFHDEDAMMSGVRSGVLRSHQNPV
jgi:hypothetical protein